MKRFLVIVMALSIALTTILTGLPTVLAEDVSSAEGASSGEAPGEDSEESRFPPAEPRDLRTLFPDDLIITMQFSDFSIQYPASLGEFSWSDDDPDECFLMLQNPFGILSIDRLAPAEFSPTYVDECCAGITSTQLSEQEHFTQEGIDYQPVLTFGMDIDFHGKRAAEVFSFSDLTYSNGASRHMDRNLIYVPLGENGELSFLILSENLQSCEILYSILNTVTWKE